MDERKKLMKMLRKNTIEIVAPFWSHPRIAFYPQELLEAVILLVRSILGAEDVDATREERPPVASGAPSRQNSIAPEIVPNPEYLLSLEVCECILR